MADIAIIRGKLIDALLPKYYKAFIDSTPVQQWTALMEALAEADNSKKQQLVDAIAQVQRNTIGSTIINGFIRPYLRTKAGIEVDEKLADGSLSLDEYERIHG